MLMIAVALLMLLLPTIATAQGCEVTGPGARLWGDCANFIPRLAYPPIGSTITADVGACYAGTQTQPLRMVICNETLEVIGEIAGITPSTCSATAPDYTLVGGIHTTVAWTSTAVPPRIYCQWYLGTTPVDSLPMWGNAHLSWGSPISVCQCNGAPPCLGQYVGGPSAGHPCYLMPPGNIGMTAEQKKATQDYGSVLSAIALALQFCKHATCGLGQTILGISTALLDLLARVDPPDANYLDTAAIVPTAYTRLVQTCPKGKKCTVTAQEASVANALFDTIALTNGIEDAMLTTVNRLSTAIADNQFEGIALQINYLTLLKTAWAAQLLDTAAKREALATVLNQRQAGLGDVWIPAGATPAEAALALAVRP